MDPKKISNDAAIARTIADCGARNTACNNHMLSGATTVARIESLMHVRQRLGSNGPHSGVGLVGLVRPPAAYVDQTQTTHQSPSVESFSACRNRT
jgi:hypothetical protein